MNRIPVATLFTLGCALFALAAPASAQIELTGTYSTRMYEDYIERGPGEFMGNFSGMPLTDEGRAKALLYTSNLPSTYERQCLAQSTGVFQYRPGGLDIWSELAPDGSVLAWVLGGDNLRGDMRIWMDGRPHPSPNAQHTEGGFATGRWEGDTLTVRTTHVKTAWIRRGVGIPGSDDSTFTMHISRHGEMLTVTTIQEDPHYLTEPHVVSRVWQWNPRATGTDRAQCNTGNEIPSIEDTGIVPHQVAGKNPEADYMIRTFNLPKEAAMGYAETLYPEYRKKIRSTYVMPATCDDRAPGYCCGWIERQGRPGGAPGLTCNDGGFGALRPGARKTKTKEVFMTPSAPLRVAFLASALLAVAGSAFAQVEISGAYAPRMYEDYIERGPGEFMGNFTGMPLSDDGRAKALLYTSNQPSMFERQCLAQSAGIFQYRPRGIQIIKELDETKTDIVAWTIGGDNLRGEIKIWMDGRPHPSPNAQHTEGGFATGKWEGRTLSAKVTHLKAAWIRRGVGIPGSDDTTLTLHITRHDDMLTITSIQEDPHYLTEPHVVSRVWQFDPGGDQTQDGVCVTANEIPSIEDTGIVPHQIPGKNPEADFMLRTYNLPKEAALGYAQSLYPEYRKTIRNTYTPPAACGERSPGYCCGWIERQGLPGGAPNLTCNDGGFGKLGPRGRAVTEPASR